MGTIAWEGAILMKFRMIQVKAIRGVDADGYFF
jgi:hypothetical protein